MKMSVLFLLSALALFGGSFRASSVKVDITPENSQWLLGYSPRQSTGVYDHIFHRVIAMDDGETQMYIVSTDVCLFSPSVYDDVAAELERQTGIDRKHFWWAVTHTHSAPEVGPPDVYKMLLKGRSGHEPDQQYTQLIKTSLIEAIKKAKASLEPARLQIGTGISQANINRRARDVDGKISLGLNPDGPVDRQIGLIRLERPNGEVIGLAVNYALHGTVMGGQSLVISGDGPGVVAAYLEQKLGGNVVYLNGAAGNAAPIYSVYPDPKSGHLSEFRVLLGDRVLEANARMPRGSDDVKLQADETFVETPLKQGLEWPSELSRYLKAEGADPARIRMPVRFLRIGDTAIWTAPVELFSEIAIEVRKRSPFARTFYSGYTNGWLGYLPTAQAFSEGGYEPSTSPFTPAAEADLTGHVLSFLVNSKNVKR